MINKHKSNKIKENSNTVRHLNNRTDHRHSKSCCDQSSPARRTMRSQLPGGRLNIKMQSYQYRDSHVEDKMVLSLTWESPYLGKTVFILRWGPWPNLQMSCSSSHYNSFEDRAPVDEICWWRIPKVVQFLTKYLAQTLNYRISMNVEILRALKFMSWLKFSNERSLSSRVL